MALFDLEKIFLGVMSQMGMTPEKVAGVINGALAELETFKREIAAFKVGAGKMAGNVNDRFNTIDAKLERIETLLLALNDDAALKSPVLRTLPAIEHQKDANHA